MEAVADFVRVGKARSDPSRLRVLSCRGVQDVRDGQYASYGLRRPACSAFGESARLATRRGDPDRQELRERALVVGRERIMSRGVSRSA